MNAKPAKNKPKKGGRTKKSNQNSEDEGNVGNKKKGKGGKEQLI